MVTKTAPKTAPQ